MLGKYFLLTVALCLTPALTQNLGDNLEEAIKNGLRKAEEIRGKAELVISTYADTSLKIRNTIAWVADESIDGTRATKALIKDTLDETVKRLKDEAKKLDKPQVVYECIDRIRKNASKPFDDLIRKYKVEVTILKSNKMDDLDFEEMALDEYLENIRGMYNVTVRDIMTVNRVEAIDNLIRLYLQFYDAFQSAMSQLQDNIKFVFDHHEKEFSEYNKRYKKQLNTTMSAVVGKMRECLDVWKAILMKSTLVSFE